MYIKDLSCICPQKTIDSSFMDGEIMNYSSNLIQAIEPDYSEIIPKGLLRRMGKAIRIGIGSGIFLLNKHKDVKGIIIGTANGGLEDCIKFLNQIVQYDEGSLTPTNFVQSTPNGIAANLAMMTKNSSYNNTHVNMGLAFESALVDASLFFDEQNGKLLVGSVEEISDYNFNIDFLKGWVKKEDCSLDSLYNSNSTGSIIGEGACMFVLENSQENALVRIVDVTQMISSKQEDVDSLLNNFLQKNKLNTSDIDAVMIGLNGDLNHDYRYHQIIDTHFPDQTILTYKNCVGEYPTASGFALWLTSNILVTKKIPKSCLYKSGNKQIKRILIYNHYFGKLHGFILVEGIK